jgi:hypothetical protein
MVIVCVSVCMLFLSTHTSIALTCDATIHDINEAPIHDLFPYFLFSTFFKSDHLIYSSGFREDWKSTVS